MGIIYTREGTWTHSKEASQRRDVNDQEGQGQSWLTLFFLVTPFLIPQMMDSSFRNKILKKRKLFLMHVRF